MSVRRCGWSALMVCALALTANGATTLLFDNFNEDTPGDGQRNLTNWTVVRGTVDVLPPGSLGVNTDRGNFLDMDGTDMFAGDMVSKQTFTLTPGLYTLTFDVGGSMRDYVTAPNTMIVSLGDVFKTTITKNFNDPFVTVSFPITVTSATTGQLSFDHQGGDQVGLLLDNVVLTSGSAVIPLPAAAWTGMATLGGIALFGRLRRRWCAQGA